MTYIFFLYSIPVFIILYIRYLYIYKNNIKEDTPIQKYIRKYIEDYNNLETKDLIISNISKNDIVREDIYFYGDTILYYNGNTNFFEYYNDRGSLPYKILESLVRKYTITYDRKALFVNIYDELNKSNRLYDTLLKKDKEDKEDNEDKNNVFVTLKKRDINNSNLKRTLLIKEKIINFKYIGKIYEYNNNNNLQIKKKYNYNDYINDIKQ